jgi:RyR domain/TrkA-N domain
MPKHLSASNFNRFISLLTMHAGRLASFINDHKNKIQVIAGAVALALGFWGWMIEKPPADLRGIMDNVFRTAQLITLQFPSLSGSPSTILQIARLAVPLVAVLASFQVLIASITRPARMALLPRIADHIVVCGFAGMTETALETLVARGRQIVVVIPNIANQQRNSLEGIGLTVVDADPLQSVTIRSLSLSRAAAVFLLGSNDIDNVNIAMLAIAAVDGRSAGLSPLVLAVKIDREELAVELDATLDWLSRRYGVRFHRLSPSRENVRLELTRFAPALLKADIDAPSHVLVVGLLGDWRQIVSTIVVATQDNPDKRPVLTFIVDQHDADALERWRKSHPQLDMVTEIVVLTRDGDAILPSGEDIKAWREHYHSPQLAVVLREDADAIASMLALRRPGSPFGTETVPILVHQSKNDRLLSIIGHTEVGDRNLTNLVAIGDLVRAETIERILDRKGDEMAAALHAHYLAAAKSLGVGSQTAMDPWENLPENLRDANRASVEHAPLLLAAAGYKLVAKGKIQSATLSEAEIELMAKVEHRRWMADHIERGWQFAQTRDDRLMLHPDLVPYEALIDNGREKDRNAVRTLCSVLEKQGFTIVRSKAAV